MIRRAPSFYTYLPVNSAELRQGMEEFAQLLINLEAVSDYFKNLNFQAAYGSKEELLDPLRVPSDDMFYWLNPRKDFDEIIEFLTRIGQSASDGAGFWMSSSTSEDGYVDKSLNYRWGGRIGLDQLTFDNSRAISNINFRDWLRIAEVVIQWKRPRYFWCGDGNYSIRNKGIFQPDRTIANWFCWVPQQVEPSQIPSAAIVRPMLDGTLIVSLEQYFNIDHLEAVQRVNDVEVEMNEAGILPHHTELNGS